MIDATKPYEFRDMVVPQRMLPGLLRYLQQGIPPGEFWQAVLRNDLRGACERADDENRHILPAYIALLYNDAPLGSWGSPENYEAWLARFPALPAKDQP